MTIDDSTIEPAKNPIKEFISLLDKSIAEKTMVNLVLGKYHGTEANLTRLSIRPVTIQKQDSLSFVYGYKTRDITKNYQIEEGVLVIADLLESTFHNAQLFTTTQSIQLGANNKGAWRLYMGKSSQKDALVPSHNREKLRFFTLDNPFLSVLGIADANHVLIPTMAKKWKQINKFIEVFDAAIKTTDLATADCIDVVDFGSGKGYLTFAMYDYLHNLKKLNIRITGVELREDLVTFCNGAATKLVYDNLVFKQGDISSFETLPVSIMVALHACDTATDEAIFKGISANASIIMCSPCCHKQIRPQINIPEVLEPVLKHGIHLGQEAEVVTDSLRALLLELNGYAAQIFEFVGLEHTSKNKMILGVKHGKTVDKDVVQKKISAIKEFYGITDVCLERLLVEKKSRC
jgi:SAM-dependent methyltransferase